MVLFVRPANRLGLLLAQFANIHGFQSSFALLDMETNPVSIVDAFVTND
jgi:hypothetical protein